MPPTGMANSVSTVTRPTIGTTTALVVKAVPLAHTMMLLTKPVCLAQLATPTTQLDHYVSQLLLLLQLMAHHQQVDHQHQQVDQHQLLLLLPQMEIALIHSGMVPNV